LACGQQIISPVNAATLYFAYPGELDTATGGYHYDRRLIQELRRLGLEVEPVSLGPGFPRPNPETLRHAEQILGQLPDSATVIIDGLAFGVLDELAAAEARRLRIIALCHHPLAFESGLDAGQQQTFMQSERLALQCAAAVVVTSPYTATLLAEQFSVPAECITVAVPGNDRIAFASGDGNPVRLLTVASLTERKGHDVLIDALAQLRELPWVARFVGSDEFDPRWAKQLRTQVKQQQLDERIEFAGKVADPGPEYLQADVFVLPSRFEGYGMVFTEALAAGLPVIAARAGAVPEVVPDAAGRLVPPDDSVALSRALHDIITDHHLRCSLRSGAREAASTLPTWADSALVVAQRIKEVQQQ
jgi:glycosyltransferase involved in cell wall biosynthesis